MVVPPPPETPLRQSHQPPAKSTPPKESLPPPAKSSPQKVVEVQVVKTIFFNFLKRKLSMSLFYFTILSQNPLPAKWQQVLPPEMAAWVAKCLFKGSDLRTATQMWYHPPEPRQVHPAPPASAEPYFRTRFFLWTPKKTWGLQLKCSEECERELSKT